MKILFVNPRFPKSLWGFQGMYDLIGVRSGQAPLGLMTVAPLGLSAFAPMKSSLTSLQTRMTLG